MDINRDHLHARFYNGPERITNTPTINRSAVDVPFMPSLIFIEC